MTDAELKRILEGHTTENRRHLNEVIGRFHRRDARHQIQLIAEDVSEMKKAIARETAGIREEMHRGISERRR